MIFLRNAAVLASITLFCCPVLHQYRFAKFGWHIMANERFVLSNRAARKFPLAAPAQGRAAAALLGLQVSSQFPVNVSVQETDRKSVV